MSTAIIPKSEFRKNMNISIGYGEIPAVQIPGTDIYGWGLPGGLVTFSEEEALAYATKLDKEIRSRLKNPKKLITLI